MAFRRRGGPQPRFEHCSDCKQSPDDENRGVHDGAPTCKGFWCRIGAQGIAIDRLFGQLGHAFASSTGAQSRRAVPDASGTPLALQAW